jgi:type II secretory pathway predicted ATPase ExeA
MYEKHFGLLRLPFTVAADPGNFYFGSIHQEALAKLRYGVESRKGLITIVGEPGTGKTSLLRMFVGSVAPTIRTVIIYDPRIAWKKMLQLILNRCGLKAPRSDSEAMIRRLDTHLKGEQNHHRTVVLLIDEAQTLSEDLLEQLRLLSNLEAKHEKLLQIILAGQPELEEKLAEPKLSPLKQRIALSLQLSPLKPDEVNGYIQFMLEKAGYQGKELFDRSVVERIFLYSKGTPRLVNSLCDNALFTTYQSFEQSVSMDRIDKAARDLKLQLQTNSDTPTDDLTDGTLADSHTATLTSSSQNLAREVPTEFSFGADQPNNDELWQTDFAPSALDDEELTMTRGSGRRARAAGLLIFLVVIFITAAGLIYWKMGSDDTRQAESEPQQTNVREANFPEPIQDDPERGHLVASIGNSLSPAPTETSAALRGVPRVFVHTPTRRDRPVIEEVGKALHAAGYDLPDTRVAAGKTDGDVRFFFPDDRQEANEIKTLVEGELRKHGYPVSLQLLERDGRKFQYAAPGKIEVWLPSLASLSKVNDS